VTVTVFERRSKKREIRQGAKKGDSHRFGEEVEEEGDKEAGKKVTVTGLGRGRRRGREGSGKKGDCHRFGEEVEGEGDKAARKR